VRLFVALDLPDEVESAVEAQVQAARALGTPLRWVVPQQWHITLAFYGEVDERKVDDLTERLARAARRRRPFAVSIGDPGRFGSARRARVVWVGLDEGIDQLTSLAASARAAGRRVGLRRDDLAADIRYRPHITVARVVPSTSVQDVLDAMRSAHRPRWTAREALLVRSEPGTGQGGRVVHTVLARLPFGGSGVDPHPS
jgi:RNA 2',3'-cyclic 3'-phosphodiesterase